MNNFNNTNMKQFNCLNVSVNDVLKAAKSMRSSDCLDFYDMSNNVIKGIVVGIAEPLDISI